MSKEKKGNKSVKRLPEKSLKEKRVAKETKRKEKKDISPL